jgi:hypothetical protein
LPREGEHPPRRVFETEECVFEWPERYAHWHDGVAAALAERQVETALDRWPRAPGPKPRLIVCSDPGDAALVLAARGLRADPRVPRTYPSLRLAIVPLPLDDGLLAALPSPPQSWMESLHHEWQHLQAAGRQDYAAAPAWFHEGMAEAANLKPSAAWAASWPPPAPGSQPAEILHQIWALWALQALARGSERAPWEWADATDAATAAQILAELRANLPRPDGDPAAALWRWRGRDAEAEDAAGRYLAAPLPGQIVEVDLPALAPGAHVVYALRTGASGRPDAGLLLAPRAGEALRLRCDAAGGLAAWAEASGSAPRNQGTDRAAASARPGSLRAVRIEHRGDELALLADDGFLHRHPLPEAARDYPVRVVLYARGGAFAAQRQP